MRNLVLVTAFALAATPAFACCSIPSPDMGASTRPRKCKCRMICPSNRTSQRRPWISGHGSSSSSSA